MALIPSVPAYPHRSFRTGELVITAVSSDTRLMGGKKEDALPGVQHGAPLFHWDTSIADDFEALVTGTYTAEGDVLLIIDHDHQMKWLKGEDSGALFHSPYALALSAEGPCVVFLGTKPLHDGGSA